MRDENIEDRPAFQAPGWIVLVAWIVLALFLAWTVLPGFFSGRMSAGTFLLGVIGVPALLLAAKGFTILQPNIGGVLTFFGSYAGTIRRDGFCWVNPLASLQRVSLRIHNLNTPTLKVNDKGGNPVEVAAVIAWRVSDAARALLDVEDHAAFVHIQAESALRQVASSRHYDGDKDGNDSLRGDLEHVAAELVSAIQSHVERAGIEILEARISHLAYAPEIASAMLRRQQADAVIAARTRIVHGAVTMVRMMLDQLESEKIVTLTERDRVGLVRDIMTVLVSESETQPVLSVARATE
jgi:hypothetical protein